MRDWTRFLRHRIKKYSDSPVHTLSDSLRIHFFPLWRAYLSFSGFAVDFAGYVWTVAVSGTKKLRIRKYPDTCGRGLSDIIRPPLRRNSLYEKPTVAFWPHAPALHKRGSRLRRFAPSENVRKRLFCSLEDLSKSGSCYEEVTWIWKQAWSSIDKTIIELSYCKTLWFVSVSPNIYFPPLSASANNFDLLSTDKLKSHWLRISRMAGQVRKIGNPETLLKEHF